MGKHKRIKLFDPCDYKYIYVPLEKVQKHYNEFVGTDYEDIDDFIRFHGISERHKKAIMNNEKEKK